ncbi:MAG TPA: hypothetical protein PK823_02155 [Novosphingobium sp.]|nr:hypothetical protein [Novosphingobium sp.]
MTPTAIPEKIKFQKSQVWLLTSNLIAPNKVGATAPIFALMLIAENHESSPWFSHANYKN